MRGGSGRRVTGPDRWRPLWRVAGRLEFIQLRWLGTSALAVMLRRQVLALETRGRRTGRRRRSPVAYLDRGGAYLVGGGAAGMSRVDWVANLRARPEDAAVWIRRRRIPVVARELVGPEYDDARRIAVERWPGSEKYERISGRRTPYFELTPMDR